MKKKEALPTDWLLPKGATITEGTKTTLGQESSRLFKLEGVWPLCWSLSYQEAHYHWGSYYAHCYVSRKDGKELLPLKKLLAHPSHVRNGNGLWADGEIALDAADVIRRLGSWQCLWFKHDTYGDRPITEGPLVKQRKTFVPVVRIIEISTEINRREIHRDDALRGWVSGHE